MHDDAVVSRSGPSTESAAATSVHQPVAASRHLLGRQARIVAASRQALAGSREHLSEMQVRLRALHVAAADARRSGDRHTRPS